MRHLPEPDKKRIQEQIDVFKVRHHFGSHCVVRRVMRILLFYAQVVQTKFEREVGKWDDAGNDIIVLAKYMCMIMMEMTDFTRHVYCSQKTLAGASCIVGFI